MSVLSPDGTASPLAWTRIVPPDSRMGPADKDVRTRLVAESLLRVKTFVAPDRESAAEILGARLASADAVAATPPTRAERSVLGTLHVSWR